jgi:glycosyltransferase involved in cell wall biosynthesis
MKILYPYNEILPNHKAHDSYLYQSCGYLAQAGMQVTLLCGKGSLTKEQLDHHYHMTSHPNLSVHPLPILRKNTLFNISYNYPFFFLCQREIKRIRPDLVMISVFKQGRYHLQRKLPGIKYIYEVHELSYYPGEKIDARVMQEKELFEKIDLLVVTTHALKEILQKPPYHLSTPIVVLPLATHMQPLAPPKQRKQLHLFYVGALYREQGIELLLHALAETAQVQLTLIGGTQEEIVFYKTMSEKLNLAHRVSFLGFQPPHSLQKHITDADAFVAPFNIEGRMAYVAHTKLHDYIAWGRAVIAPNVAVVREHLGDNPLLFTPGNKKNLAECIQKLQTASHRMQYQERISNPIFTWENRMEHYQRFLKSL